MHSINKIKLYRAGPLTVADKPTIAVKPPSPIPKRTQPSPIPKRTQPSPISPHCRRSWSPNRRRRFAFFAPATLFLPPATLRLLTLHLPTLRLPTLRIPTLRLPSPHKTIPEVRPVGDPRCDSVLRSDPSPPFPSQNQGCYNWFFFRPGKYRVKDSLKNPPLGWNGDPCMPRQYSWSGITCSDGPRIRVISLFLIDGFRGFYFWHYLKTYEDIFCWF
nr:hypothetical protein CFP56_28291 [Quercus suber]